MAAEELERYFGWMAPFAGLNMIASNAWTRARLGSGLSGPDLLADLAAMGYSAPARSWSIVVLTGRADVQPKRGEIARLGRRFELAPYMNGWLV